MSYKKVFVKLKVFFCQTKIKICQICLKVIFLLLTNIYQSWTEKDREDLLGYFSETLMLCNDKQLKDIADMIPSLIVELLYRLVYNTL